MPHPDQHEVTHALDKIRRSAAIEGSELTFLTYIVEQTLRGSARDLSQKTIAADVFRRDLGKFDGRADSIVRTTGSKLRGSLFHYYATKGRDDAVVIELPTGSYIPHFRRRDPLTAKSTSFLWSARSALDSRSVSGYRIAIEQLAFVLKEAPDLPLALALKAEALASCAIHGFRPRPNLEEARLLALRALDRRDPVWQAWLAQGIVQQALEWNWREAEQCYGNALSLSAGESGSHVWYTAFLVGRGRPAEAVARLRPVADQFGYGNPTMIGDLCMLLLLVRDFDSARCAIEAAIEATPDYYQHYLNLAILMEALGDPGEAVRILDRAPLRLSERPVTWGLRSLFAGLSGQPKAARRRLSWLRGVSKARYVPPSQFAACWLGLGQPDQAVRSLEQAADERDPLAVWYYAYPFFRHLHGHPDFEALIDRIGLVRTGDRTPA